MKKQLERIIYICIGLSFFVPLILAPHSFIFPFIVPKIIVFRILTLVMFGAYSLLLMLDWETYRPKFTSVTVTVLLFLLSLVLSTVFGVDWYKSLWDSHERMLGLFTLAHFVVYYLIVTSVITSWRNLIRIFLGAGSIVMFIAMIQKVNPQFLLNSGSDRSMATLGNAIYVSGYGLFLWYLGLVGLLQEKTHGWKIYSLIAALGGFAGIFLGGTRGTLIGLVVSIAVIGMIYMVKLRDHKRIRIGIGAGFAIAFGVAILLFSFRTTPFVSHLPAVGRLFNTSLTDTSTTPRVMAWGIAVESWKERPVFGWGPNNFFYAFNKHYRPQFLESGWGETWFDNAHNIIMNTLASQGIFGVVTYLAIFIASLVMLSRALKQKKISVYVAGIYCGFLVGHLVHNIFVFENPTSYLYFFFILAMINAICAERTVLTEQKSKKKTVSGGMLALVWGVVIVLVFVTNVNPARANMATVSALQKLYTNVPQSLMYYEKALSYGSPHSDDIRMDMSRTISALLPQLYQAKRIKDAELLFLFAHKELEKNKQAHPLDVRMDIQLAQLEDFAGTTLGKKEYLLKEEETLTKALLLSPKRQQIKYMLADAKQKLGKNDEAAQILKESIADDPKIAFGWLRLLLTYANIGDKQNAQQTLAEAKKQGVVFQPGNEKLINFIEQM